MSSIILFLFHFYFFDLIGCGNIVLKVSEHSYIPKKNAQQGIKLEHIADQKIKTDRTKGQRYKNKTQVVIYIFI